MSTIVAIATALGNKGINIIRISGKDSLNIIEKIFTNSKKLAPNTIVYGKIKNENNILDNVLVSYFKAPNSFTGEDVVEINCHGGTLVTKLILDLLLENGAILAGPGEFSKRAFINGKMDLSEAEGIINLINSKSRLEAKIATSDMNGRLNGKISDLKNKLIELLAHIEVTVDYPEYDYDEVADSNVENLLNEEIEELNKLILSYDQGKFVKEGINVAILGKPNVGKSSLLNCLLKVDRAIVTDIPGTTRDTIEETVNIGDVTLNITDTAGIRETEDVVEKIGVEKSLKKIDEADLILYLFDPTRKIEKDEIETLSKIQNKGIKNICVINKIDLTQKDVFGTFMKELKSFGVEFTINISTSTEFGIKDLKSKITSMFFQDEIFTTNEIIIVSERHKDLLRKAKNNLEEVKEQLRSDMPIDIMSIKIKDAAKKLGEIIGSDVNSDVISKIFEKFCLGK